MRVTFPPTRRSYRTSANGHTTTEEIPMPAFDTTQLGPEAPAIEPVVMETGPRFSRKVKVTVTEHEHGWAIVGQPTEHAGRHHGRFTGLVPRCRSEHFGGRGVPSDCLGHRDHVLVLAKKVLNTYR